MIKHMTLNDFSKNTRTAHELAISIDITTEQHGRNYSDSFGVASFNLIKFDYTNTKFCCSWRFINYSGRM